MTEIRYRTITYVILVIGESFGDDAGGDPMSVIR